MVIGLLTIGAIPTVIGVGEAISAQKRQNAAMKEKAKFHLTATLSVDGGPAEEAFCILTDGQLYIDHSSAPKPGHKFTGYYFTYPSEAQHRGLVSTIADDPPMLNWLYVDKDTGALRYGGRKDTLGHVIGPWGWSADEEYLTLHGDDTRFIAVEDEESRKWTVWLALDRDGRLEPVGQPSLPAGEGASANVSGGPGGDQTQAAGEEEGAGGELVDVRTCRKWAPIKLRRRMQLGMESRYVKGEKQ
ncbi:hypothetical protein NKR23_g4664 [Pleurostoma richardsiae]|uniref:Uncharacterized protein n=1 Tax=Pleurostoma richardsiae TaxID=41990 RepID=A0AA38RG02_9PEZI|nr:hypothetical protein NKR23_g4664 [Pleurostoma richardsiae]